jgi:hypothetical protein
MAVKVIPQIVVLNVSVPEQGKQAFIFRQLKL